MLKIESLVWDDWNINHIKKHQVNLEEVEEACKDILKTFKSYKGRLILTGKTKNKRLLTVILALENDNQYYVVTARDTSKKERGLIK